MIKAIFTALTGIDESIDTQESQASWERRRHADENDLDDFDLDSDATDDNDDNDDSDRAGENFTGWFGLW
jgi:hypothetical protein